MIRRCVHNLKRSSAGASLSEALDYHERTPAVRSSYLPLAAATGGRYSGQVELLLRDVAMRRGFMSQFWVSGRALHRDFNGRILEGEEPHGVDIGIGFGPVQVYNVADIEASDFHFFLQQFPLPPDDGGFGSHLVFVDGKWSRFKSAQLNGSLDHLHMEQVERLGKLRDDAARAQIRGGGDVELQEVPNTAPAAASVAQPQAAAAKGSARTSPERRLAVALERMAVAVPFAQPRHEAILASLPTGPMLRQHGRPGTLPPMPKPASPTSALRYTASEMLSHPPRRWILKGDVEKRRLTLAPHAQLQDAISTGGRLFNACQTTLHATIEGMWRGRIPEELIWRPNGEQVPLPSGPAAVPAMSRMPRSAMPAGLASAGAAAAATADPVGRWRLAEADSEARVHQVVGGGAADPAGMIAAARTADRPLASVQQAKEVVSQGEDAMNALLKQYLGGKETAASADF